MDLHVAPDVLIPGSELLERFTRSGGPGGQNVNKRSTRAELVFDLRNSPSVPPDLKRRALRRLASRLDASGAIRVTASDERTQAANREVARERLRELLENAFRPPPPPRRPTKPSKAAKERRVSEKKRRGDVKRARRAPAHDE